MVTTHRDRRVTACLSSLRRAVSGLVGYEQLPEAWRFVRRDCGCVVECLPVALDAAEQPLVNKVSGCAPNGPQGG